jgi:hypothetical protein
MGIFYGVAEPHSAGLKPVFGSRKVEKNRWTVILVTSGRPLRKPAPRLGSALGTPKQSRFLTLQNNLQIYKT